MTVFVFRRWRQSSWFLKDYFWLTAAIVITMILSYWCHLKTILDQQLDTERTDRLQAYNAIKKELKDPNRVILTTEWTNDVAFSLNCYVYFSTYPNMTYSTSVSTEELFKRYIYASRLIRGTDGFLPNLMEHNGIPLNKFVAELSKQDQYWFNLLRNAIGSNSFIFHPYKNRYDLKAKGVSLPLSVNHLNEMIIFLPPNLKKTYASLESLSRKQPYRLDWCLISKDPQVGYRYQNLFDVVFENRSFLVLRPKF